MSRTAWIWIVVVIVIIAGGLWWWSSMQAPAANQAAATPATQDMGNTGSSTSDTSGSITTVVTTTTTAPMSATVTYDGNSFSPASVTIAQGGTVTWVDNNGGPLWVATDPHPAHTGYDGTTRQVHCASGYTGPTPFDECSTGTTYSFTFQKVGSWGYHNHMNPGVQGVVNVVAQ